MLAIERLNHLSRKQLKDEFLFCCDATRWASMMVSLRPFLSEEDLYAKSLQIWRALSEDDWVEAFNKSPQIGDHEALSGYPPHRLQLMAIEQAGTFTAVARVLNAIEEANGLYRAKFGFNFVADVAGMDGRAILALLMERFHNNRPDELKISMEAQAKITQKRLHKLLELLAPTL